MKKINYSIFFTITTLILSVISFIIVLEGASEEPYGVFHKSDAVTQVGIAMILMLMWLQLGIAIVVGVVCRRISIWWLTLLVWVLICEFYLSCCPFGYLDDIERFVIGAQ